MNARSALVLLLGLVIGILGTVFAMKALDARDPMPKAVMTVMGFHMGSLAHAVKAGQCAPGPVNDDLRRLDSTAGDIPLAFAGAEPDFLGQADKLRKAVSEAVQAHPADCKSLAAAIRPVGDACKSCHERYR